MAIDKGKYIHFKGGQYVVIGTAQFQDDPTKKYVLYKPGVTAAADADKYYLRSEENFLEDVQVAVPRFRKQV